MKRVKGRPGSLRLLVLLLLCCVLLLSNAAYADDLFDSTCPCGCGTPNCTCSVDENYGSPGNWIWPANDDRYENIDNENGTITYTEDGLLIDNIKKNHSWTYSFDVPRVERNRLDWHVRLEVRNATGVTVPGVILENNAIGVSFRVHQGLSQGELTTIHTDVVADTIATFDVPKFEYPCALGLDYDAKTGLLQASINDTIVKEITLPYYGMPAIATVTSICVETSTPEGSAAGSALFGDLVLRTE